MKMGGLSLAPSPRSHHEGDSTQHRRYAAIVQLGTFDLHAAAVPAGKVAASSRPPSQRAAARGKSFVDVFHVLPAAFLTLFIQSSPSIACISSTAVRVSFACFCLSGGTRFSSGQARVCAGFSSPLARSTATAGATVSYRLPIDRRIPPVM